MESSQTSGPLHWQVESYPLHHQGNPWSWLFFLDYFPFFQKKDETIYKTKKGLYSLPQVKIPNFPKSLHRNKAKVKVAIKTFKFTQLELTLVYESPSQEYNFHDTLNQSVGGFVNILVHKPLSLFLIISSEVKLLDQQWERQKYLMSKKQQNCYMNFKNPLHNCYRFFKHYI